MAGICPRRDKNGTQVSAVTFPIYFHVSMVNYKAFIKPFPLKRYAPKKFHKAYSLNYSDIKGLAATFVPACSNFMTASEMEVKSRQAGNSKSYCLEKFIGIGDFFVGTGFACGIGDLIPIRTDALKRS